MKKLKTPYSWILWLVWKLFGKVVRKTLAPSVAGTGTFGDVLRKHIESFSDDELDKVISNMKQRDWSKKPHDVVIESIKEFGMNIDTVLHMLEAERSIREHRKKYQQEGG